FTNVINETTKSIENISTKIGNFLKENKESIQGIVDSMSVIFKTIGSAIWETFSNTIKTIGKAFGVVGENSSKTNSTLETIDSLLKKIASHKKAIDLLTKSLIGLRSEEHTSELQSRFDLVCSLLLEKKKYIITC